MSGWVYGWGLDFLVFMSNLGGRTLDILSEPFHWLGGPVGYVGLMPVLFWSVNDRTGRRLYTLAMGNALLNGILKVWWAGPRPYQIAPDRIHPSHLESSYGIPSGHSQGGMVMGLFFARLSSSRRVKNLMYLLIFLMGISRMIIGVHFLQDVLAGWLLGFLFFNLYLWFENRILPLLQNWPAAALISLAVIPALIVLGSEYAPKGSYPVTKNLLATGGALSGILLGMILEKFNGYYRSGGRVLHKILRIPLGVVILAGLYILSSRAFHAAYPHPQLALPGVMVYIVRFILVGFTGYWLIPELFVRIGLAGRREKT